MPRSYVRKTDRRSWTEETLAAAVDAVRMGLSKSQAAIQCKIPRKTITRYLNLDSLNEHQLTFSQLGSFSPVFNAIQEQELVQFIIQMNQYGLSVTRQEMRSLAFQLAEKNQINHPFCRETELAGRDWLDGFLKRHPELSLRSPEPTSLARLKGFNRESVDRFYQILGEIYASAQFPPSHIYNADETGFSTVTARAMKVIAKKGVRQVPGAVSGERGVNTTAIMDMSAVGQFLPPMLIFPRKRMNEALKVGAPPETVFACYASGWSTTTTFSMWFDHFLSCTRPTADSPVLLILDDHSSHTRNLEMLEKAKKNHVRILVIPPHTSHKLQPLDVAFMGPLKTNYIKAIEKLQKQNPGTTITIHNVSSLVNEAFMASSSVATAQNGFRATGIFPFNRHIFAESDFAASDFLTSDPSNVNDPTKEDYPDAQGIVDSAYSMEYSRLVDQSMDVNDSAKEAYPNAQGIVNSAYSMEYYELVDQSMDYVNIGGNYQQCDESDIIILDPNIYITLSKKTGKSLFTP